MKSFLKKLLVLIGLGFGIESMAQNVETLTISLQQAIDLALKNRYDLQSQQIQVSIAKNTITRKTNEWLPDISANGNIRYNTQLQQNVLPAGFGGSTSDQRVAFGTKNNTSFSLDLTQPIFKPGLTDDIKIAKNNALLEEEKYKQKQGNIKTIVAEAYLNILLKELQLSMAKEDEIRYREYFLLAEGKFKAGTLLESDYLSAKLDWENSKSETLSTEHNKVLVYEKLKYALNMSLNTQVVLSDQISKVALMDESIEPSTPKKRTEIQQLEIQQWGNQLSLTRSYKTLLPTLSFYANYSTQFQYNDFDYTGHPWNPYNYIGLKLTLPITESFKNISTIREYQFKKKQHELDLKQKTNDISSEIASRETEWQIAKQNMLISKNSFEFSKDVFQIKQNEYKLGTLEYSKLLDYDKTLRSSEQKYLTAVYNLLVAKLSMDMAKGL